MAKINEKFFESYVYNKLLQAVNSLSEVSNALDATEEKLRAELKSIIQQITRIEI